VAGRLHWVHSASTGLLSLFTVHAKRGQQAMDAAGVLPRFAGVAVHDGWSPYWRYEVTHALCGAHLLRELDGIVDEPGQGWAAGMAELLVDGKLAADRARVAGAAGVDDQARARLHARYERLLADGLAANPPPPATGRRRAGRAAHPRPSCSPDWMCIVTRSCGCWTIAGCRSTTIRPNAICAW
jgi:transposase